MTNNEEPRTPTVISSHISCFLLGS